MVPKADETSSFPSCDLCDRYYDDDTHSPLLLPCGHVYCSQCLSGMEDSDKQLCPKNHSAQNLADWSRKNISDLKLVKSMIPVDRGIGAAGRAIAPAPSSVDLQASGAANGRAIAPAGLQAAGFPKCEGCDGEFNNSNKLPLMIECCNTCFCRDCLLILGQQKKSCPCCSESFDLGRLNKLSPVLSLIPPSVVGRTIAAAPTLSARTQSGNDKATVYVTDTSGRRHAANVSLSDDVSSLKSNVEEKLGTKPAHQRLLHEGKEMRTGRTLGSYNVRQGSNVNMTCRQTGG